MSERTAPNFGALLAPFIEQVPQQAMPRFLALLERGAAQRYREWAVEIPEHSEVLVACARREDEIADRVDAVWAIDASLHDQLNAPLPAARALYYSIFVGLDPWEQLDIQADAELQGAAAWRGIAANHSDARVVDELLHCARLEEESSRELLRIITRRRRTGD